MINEPTRYTNNSASVLDLIFVDNEHFVKKKYGVNPPLLNLDHCCIYCNLNFKVSKTQAFKRHVWDYQTTNFNSLNTALSNASFDSAYGIFDDVEDIVCYTNELMLTTCAEFVPNKIVTVRPKDKPWMSNEVRRAIRKRDRYFKKIQRTRRDEDKLLHVIARREVNKLKR
jgi:hypothetical protein